MKLAQETKKQAIQAIRYSIATLLGGRHVPDPYPFICVTGKETKRSTVQSTRGSSGWVSCTAPTDDHTLPRVYVYVSILCMCLCGVDQSIPQDVYDTPDWRLREQQAHLHKHLETHADKYDMSRYEPSASFPFPADSKPKK